MYCIYNHHKIVCAIKEYDKKSGNENNINTKKGVIDTEVMETDEYSNTYEYKIDEDNIQQQIDRIRTNYGNRVDTS